MSEDPFKSFQDFINYCNEFYNNTNQGQEKNPQNAGYYCGDIPGGFQAINPQFFLMIGEILGNVVAGQMPFNIQNVIGNWLQLVGQAIETYNAQQQYMQSGPGRYYDIKNLNINNPFCSENQTASGQSKYEDSSQYINRNYQTTSTSEDSYDLNDMKNHKTKLEEQISELKEELSQIKNNGG